MEETHSLEFSTKNKLNESLSRYLSGAHFEKQTAELYSSLDSLYLNKQPVVPKTQYPQKISLSLPPRKPVADSSHKNIFNPDSNLLGECNPHPVNYHFQGISALLPPKQRAPENNSGE
jgi:hypothetical protein